MSEETAQSKELQQKQQGVSSVVKDTTHQDVAKLAPRDVEAKVESKPAQHNIGNKKLIQHKISRHKLNESFNKTMSHTQEELSVSKKIFSKFIHNSFIESTSNLLGSTLFRPNAILLGATIAFITTLLSYTIAKRIGYNLSGSETLIGFVFGWLIGIVFDYLHLLFVGNDDK